MPKEDKARYFTFLIYDDSAPSDWIDRLELIGQPMAISPYHDKDKAKSQELSYLGTGYKKPHYHVLYVAKNPVTPTSVRKKIQRAFGEEGKSQAVQKVVIVDNIENIYLYLTHESKDAIAKKKFRYDREEIIHLNNFDISRYVTLDVETKKDYMNTFFEFMERVKPRNIIELEKAVKRGGGELGLTVQIMREVVRSEIGLFRLYFDGYYHEAQREFEERANKK